MAKIEGNTLGLKASQLEKLKALYPYRVDPEMIVSRELAAATGAIAHEIGRQVGLLINRSGDIEWVVVGDHQTLMLPDIKRARGAASRLRGLRLVHTHLKGEGLTDDDLNDLGLLRLDMVAALLLAPDGNPVAIEYATIKPAVQNAQGAAFDTQRQSILMPQPNLLELTAEIEAQLSRASAHRQTPPPRRSGQRERAVLVHIRTRKSSYSQELVEEMQMLARSSGLEIVEVIEQMRPLQHSPFLLGRGKITDVTIAALRLGADMLLFSCDLTAAQVGNIAELTDLKIVDRSQLILDIFARRAKSRDGKLQVELAQLKYTLPRLVHKNSAMSRLAGGIGGRGPGEQKLEIDRRRARERMSRLERELKQLAGVRSQKRNLRQKREMRTVALVGYTNVGKSTLLNALCRTEVFVDDAAFATLEPTSRRWFFPDGNECILMDTVGFMRDLPEDLVTAFRATLEEVLEADLILHVVDVSHDDFFYQLESVDKILSDIGASGIPQLRVINKTDKLEPLEVKLLSRKLKATAISALDKSSLPILAQQVQEWFAAQKKLAPDRV